MPTVIIAVIIAVVLFLAGRKLWKDRKSGKSLCGGKCAGCAGCANCCSCHKAESKVEKNG